MRIAKFYDILFHTILATPLHKMEPKEIIKRARFNKGLTQTDVAKALGISLRMYQRYEEGKFPKYKDEVISALDGVLGTDLYVRLYDKSVSHADIKPSNILSAEGVNITLADYIALLHRENDRLYNLLNSSLARISDDQQIALAYQKAWVEYEAERVSKGDPKKKRDIMVQMSKLVDGKLMGGGAEGNQGNSGK